MRQSEAGEAWSVIMDGLKKENATLHQIIEKQWELNAINNSIILSLKNHGSKPAREDLFRKREEIAEDIASLEGDIGLEVKLKSPICGTSQRNKKLYE